MFSTLFEKWQSVVDNLYTKMMPLHKPFKELNCETISMLEEKKNSMLGHLLIVSFYLDKVAHIHLLRQMSQQDLIIS